jgi:hypothetical protein
MAREPRHTEIGHIPELLRLAEEVRATREPRVLTRDREALAVLSPAKTRRPRRPKTRADSEAFLSSLGGWKDLVDTEKLKKAIHESRSISTRPPIEL